MHRVLAGGLAALLLVAGLGGGVRLLDGDAAGSGVGRAAPATEPPPRAAPLQGRVVGRLGVASFNA